MSFEIYLSVSKDLCGKLVTLLTSSIFYHNLRVTSVLFFVTNFNLSSCEFDSFMFILWSQAILYLSIKINKLLSNNLTDPCEKSKIIYFICS